MKLQEYQLKNIFKQYGIPVPDGRVTSYAREAKRIAETINAPVVVKAQVLAEGRGMSGGIRLARTPEEAEEFASDILSSKIRDIPVSKVLIDEAVMIDEEYYILITYDRAEQIPVLVMYDSGSLYIETAANSLYENLDRSTDRAAEIPDIRSRFPLQFSSEISAEALRNLSADVEDFL